MPDVPDNPLLEWEDVESRNPDDAYHWIRIYNELIEFKDNLIERARREYTRLSSEARPGAVGDLELLDTQRKRFVDRRDFWVQRQRELRGIHLTPQRREIAHEGVAVEFTEREFQVVEVLAAHSGQLLPPRRIVSEAWHDPGLTSAQLRLYISRIRTKLLAIPVLEIRHERGRGYTLGFTDERDDNTNTVRR